MFEPTKKMEIICTLNFFFNDFNIELKKNTGDV